MTQEENKRYKANIAGNTYTIIGKESHFHMDMVSDLANEQIELIKQQGPTLTNEQVAVLLAINTISNQVKQQEIILSLKEERDYLEKELEKMFELEERLEKIEEREKEARKKIISEKRELTEEEALNQIEVQKVLNEQVKEKIKKNNHQKKEQLSTNNN